jgi:hypothetical protein
VSKAPSAVGPYIFGEARYAAQDIRQKLFEEAWFGRVVTAAPVIEIDKGIEPSDRAALEQAWGTARHSQQPQRELEINPEVEEAMAQESVRRWNENHQYDRDFDKGPDLDR